VCNIHHKDIDMDRKSFVSIDHGEGSRLSLSGSGRETLSLFLPHYWGADQFVEDEILCKTSLSLE